MGKVMARIKISNHDDDSRNVELEALVDTGATMMVVPMDIVRKLGLAKVTTRTVRYADNRQAERTIYGPASIELMGRTAHFDVLAERVGSQPLIGQVVLELLDLVVNPRERRLMPNPLSPDSPMVDLLRVRQGLAAGMNTNG